MFRQVNRIDLPVSAVLKDRDSPNYELAERDTKIVAMSGGKYVLSKEYIEKTYHVELEAPSSAPVPNRAWALSSPKLRDHVEKEAMGTDTKAAEHAILEKVEEIFDGAETFEEAIDALYKAFPSFGVEEVESMIERLYANAMIYGYAKSEDEHEGEV